MPGTAFRHARRRFLQHLATPRGRVIPAGGLRPDGATSGGDFGAVRRSARACHRLPRTGSAPRCGRAARGVTGALTAVRAESGLRPQSPVAQATRPERRNHGQPPPAFRRRDASPSPSYPAGKRDRPCRRIRLRPRGAAFLQPESRGVRRTLRAQKDPATRAGEVVPRGRPLGAKATRHPIAKIRFNRRPNRGGRGRQQEPPLSGRVGSLARAGN